MTQIAGSSNVEKYWLRTKNVVSVDGSVDTKSEEDKCDIVQSVREKDLPVGIKR